MHRSRPVFLQTAFIAARRATWAIGLGAAILPASLAGAAQPPLPSCAVFVTLAVQSDAASASATQPTLDGPSSQPADNGSPVQPPALRRDPAHRSPPPLPEGRVPLPAEPEVRTVRDKVGAAYFSVQGEPRNPAMWGRYAMILDAHGYATEAEQSYRRAMELQPGEFRWPYFLGVMLETRDPDSAIGVYETALRIDGAYAPAHIRRAWLLHAMGRNSEAQAHYERALQLDPASAHAMLGLAQLRAAIGDYSGAWPLLERACQADPRHAAAFRAAAECLEALGRAPEALIYRQRANSLRLINVHLADPRHFEVLREGVDRQSYFRRIDACIAANRLPEAKREVDVMLRDYAEDTQALHFGMTTYASVGAYDECIRAGRELLKRDPNHIQARTLVALSFSNVGQYDEAEREAQRGLSQQPDQPDLLALTGQLLTRRQQYEAAIDYLNRALKLRPDDYAIVGHLADALAAAERYDDALRHYRHMTELQPDNALAWSRVGAAYLRMQRFEESLAAFERTAQLAPNSSQATIGVARSLRKLGKPAESIQRLHAFLQRFPNAVDVIAELAWMLATDPDDAVRNGAAAAQIAERLQVLVAREHPNFPEYMDTLAAAYAEAGRFPEAVKVLEDAIRQLRLKGVPPQKMEPYTRRLSDYRLEKPYRAAL